MTEPDSTPDPERTSESGRTSDPEETPDSRPTTESSPGAPSGVTGAARTGLAVGVVAAVVAFAAVAAYSWLAAGATAVGGVALGVGGLRGRRGVVRVGASALAAATVVAGVRGAPPLVVGLGTWSALVAWDATTHALDVADHVGAAAATDVQLGHVRGSVLVGAAGLGVGSLGFLVGTTGSVALAGVAAVAAVALALALALP